VTKITWEQPVDVFEAAYALECAYREHIEKLVLLAKQEQDELTAQFMLKMLDD
jgi:ferritin